MNFDESGQASLLTTAQAAAHLTVSPKTMAYWRGTGTGPQFIRIGIRSVRYRYCDLQNYLDHREFSNNLNADESVRTVR